MSEPLPKARPLDPIPVQVEGQQLVFLRDPLGFSAELAVMPIVYVFLALCDGINTVDDIKLEFARRYQHILTQEQANRIYAELDHHHLLDNERFRRFRDETVQAYRREPVRVPAHQGNAYPDDPEALRGELDSYYTHPDGPGKLPHELAPDDRRLMGLIAPHISVRQGGTCFAWAYRRVCEARPIDTFVVLGTGHAEIPGCFAATRKTFQTPLGSLGVDTDFLDRLEARYGGDLCAEEIYHRSEHVIEFQTVFLQHALTGRGGLRHVPILCSYTPEAFAGGAAGDVAATTERFCNALRETIAESQQSICVICSADLAHVGQRYGDPVRLTTPDLDRLERDDRTMLDILCTGSAEGFLENLASENNRRRICGFPCIYAMLRSLDLKDGELLRYSQSAVDEQNSTVSYASVAYYDTPTGAGGTSKD